MASNTMTLTQLLVLDDKLTPETRKTLAAMGDLEQQIKQVDAVLGTNTLNHTAVRKHRISKYSRIGKETFRQ
jgi:hypothetical protein